VAGPHSLLELIFARSWLKRLSRTPPRKRCSRGGYGQTRSESLLRSRALLEARTSWRARHLPEADLIKLEDEARCFCSHRMEGRKRYRTGFPEYTTGCWETPRPKEAHRKERGRLSQKTRTGALQNSAAEPNQFRRGPLAASSEAAYASPYEFLADAAKILADEAKALCDGHLMITHTHWDHIQGFPFSAPLFVPGNTWDIYAYSI
jgi:hypothetical protein